MKKILLLGLFLIWSFSAKCQTSTVSLTVKEARWYFDQARINEGLRQDVIKYKALVADQSAKNKATLDNILIKLNEKQALVDSNTVAYTNKEQSYIREMGVYQKQVKKHKRGKTFWKIAAMLAGGWGVYQSVK